MRLFSGKDSGCRQSGRFFVPDRGRAKGAASIVDAFVDIGYSSAEGLLRVVVKVRFADAGDRDLQPLQGATKGLPEKFTFRCVNQRVRSKNCVDIRQRPRGTQKNGGANQGKTTVAQLSGKQMERFHGQSFGVCCAL